MPTDSGSLTKLARRNQHTPACRTHQALELFQVFWVVIFVDQHAKRFLQVICWLLMLIQATDVTTLQLQWLVLTIDGAQRQFW